MSDQTVRPNRRGSRIVIVVVATLATGCAAFQATQQPGKKDISVLTPGMPRTHVIAELGSPLWSDERDGDIVDVFAFKQGYSKGVKAGRALVHGAADVATFGLWEVVGIPAEMIADGTDVRVEVHYDPRQVVRSVDVIKGEKIFAKPKVAWWQKPKNSKSRTNSPTLNLKSGETSIVESEDDPPDVEVAEDTTESRRRERK